MIESGLELTQSTFRVRQGKMIWIQIYMQFSNRKMHWKIISKSLMKKEGNSRILSCIIDLMMERVTILMIFQITAIKVRLQGWRLGGFQRNNQWKSKINGVKNALHNMQLVGLLKGKKGLEEDLLKISQFKYGFKVVKDHLHSLKQVKLLLLGFKTAHFS